MPMASDDKNKKEFYRRVKIGGLLIFIPFILVAGPLGGYIAGDYLEKRFALPSYLPITLAAIGFIASVGETIRIIRIALKTDKES